MSSSREKEDPTVAAFIREETPAGDILHVLGEVDLANAEEFKKAVLAMHDAAHPVVVDLTTCTYMDSSGLRVLTIAHQALQGHLRVVIPKTGSVHRIFEITGLNAQLNACENVDQAFSESTDSR